MDRNGHRPWRFAYFISDLSFSIFKSYTEIIISNVIHNMWWLQTNVRAQYEVRSSVVQWSECSAIHHTKQHNVKISGINCISRIRTSHIPIVLAQENRWITATCRQILANRNTQWASKLHWALAYLHNKTSQLTCLQGYICPRKCEYGECDLSQNPNNKKWTDIMKIDAAFRHVDVTQLWGGCSFMSYTWQSCKVRFVMKHFTLDC